MRFKYKLIYRGDETVDAWRKDEERKQRQQGKPRQIIFFPFGNEDEQGHVHRSEQQEVEKIYDKEKAQYIAERIFPEEPEGIREDDEGQDYLGIEPVKDSHDKVRPAEKGLCKNLTADIFFIVAFLYILYLT